MKIGKNNIQLFILLFAVSSLLVHFPPEAFAEEGVIATITVGADPNSIAFDSENNRMYVTNSGGSWDENNPLAGDSISVIDTSTYEVIETVTAAGAGGNGNTPHGIAFDPVNNRMYYAIGNWMYIENDVSVMNTADNSVSATISVGNRPNDIAFDSTNNRMYVVNRNDDTVSVINTANNSVIGDPISVGDIPNDIAFDSTNNRMYVTNWNDNTVSVINTANNSVIATISVGDRPYAIAFDSENNRMYVLNNVDNTVSVINTADNSVIATISVGKSPQDIAFDSTNNRMYVLNTGDDTVSVIDTANNSVIDTISVGDSPRGIAFDSTNNRMYVTNTGDDTVSVIGIVTNTNTGKGGGCNTCIAPTMGIANGPFIKRIVEDGFTLNGKSFDVMEFKQTEELIYTETGITNNITLKIYEDTGPENIRYVAVFLGLDDTDIYRNLASIIWENDWDGKKTVTVVDEHNLFEDEFVLHGIFDNHLILNYSFVELFPIPESTIGVEIRDGQSNKEINYFENILEVTGYPLIPSTGIIQKNNTIENFITDTYTKDFDFTLELDDS